MKNTRLNIAKFLIRFHRHFMMIAVFLTIGVFTLAMSGCGVPTWLTDAQSIVALVGTSITAIGSFIAGLTGNAALAAGLAVVSDWITEVDKAIGDLETLVEQYNAAPNATLLADIESALSTVEANLAPDFSNLGLPTGILTVIAGIAGLALSQIQAWGSLIPATQAHAMTTFTVKTPYTKSQYKELINKILTTPTGDAEIDAALAKAKRI